MVPRANLSTHTAWPPEAVGAAAHMPASFQKPLRNSVHAHPQREREREKENTRGRERSTTASHDQDSAVEEIAKL